MNSLYAWRFLTIVVAAALFAVILNTAFVSSESDSGADPVQVTAVWEDSGPPTTSTTYVNLPGATATFQVPAGQEALVIVRFSGETACSSNTGVGLCLVHVLLDGTPMEPTGINDFFDSVDHDDATSAQHALERSRVVGGGVHNIQVQYRVSIQPTEFELHSWHLTVERFRQTDFRALPPERGD